MQVTVKTGNADEVSAETLAVLMFQQAPDKRRLSRPLSGLDRKLAGSLSAALASGDFRGGKDESLALYPSGAGRVKRILLIGLGDEKRVDDEQLRRAAGAAVRSAKAKGSTNLALIVPSSRRLKPADSASALAIGALLATYRFDDYRTQSNNDVKPLKSIQLVYSGSAKLGDARAKARAAAAIAEGQNVARDLSNQPANHLPPAALAREAQKVARKVGLRSRVLGEPEMKKLGMGGILAVGQGSANPSRLIVLEHKGGRAANSPPICIVGKGITFDSGGISIKPSAGMQDMKHDMSGAAAVVGTMLAVARLKLPVRVVGVIAAAENMPDGKSYRPGDIIETYKGKTIEVINTDAEGRIVLADALHYANEKYRPEAMIDLATLTGAMMVALGRWATGVFTNNAKLTEALRRAGEASGEIAWPMPLFEGHKKIMKSTVADLRNQGVRDGGASTAAAFLWEFADDTPWAHLDIAGTGWTESTTPYQPRGATGVGVRMLVELLSSWDASRDI